MNGKTSRLVLAALGALLLATNATAVASPLTIGPTLTWNTFLGGANYDRGSGIAVDASGNIYVTGSSYAAWGNPVRASAASDQASDAFVAKLDSNGVLLWNTFLGGPRINYSGGTDWGHSIAVDPSGNVYVSGSSDSLWGNPLPPWAWGGFDAFVAKLDTDGTLIWNKLLGGSGSDFGQGIAVDGSGNVYLTGYTESTWGNPIRPWAGGVFDSFVVKLHTDGYPLWNTFLGGDGYDEGRGITVDGDGNVSVAGFSSWTWGDPIRPSTEDTNAFVARLDADGALLWNTFLGVYGVGLGIADDGIGNVYVTGEGYGTWGDPIRPADENEDAFVAKLDPTGVLLWNTFLGGPASDAAEGIAVDAGGNVLVSGHSDGTWGSPIRPSQAYVSVHDAFVATLDPNGALLSSTFLGGTGDDYGRGIAADLSGAAYVVGASDAAWGNPLRPKAEFRATYLAKLENSVPIDDVTAPTGSILINNGAASTTTTAVTLKLAATDAGGSGVSSMRFRNRDTDPYGAWEPYLATKSWTLPSELGTRKVYVQFMDLAGNISDANPAAAGVQGYMDAITLSEGIAPTGTIRINNGAASTSTPAVTLNLAATDAGGSGLASMRFRNSTAEPYSAWEPYQATKPWALIAGAGTRKVYAQFRDGAGNVSDANAAVAGAQGCQDSITLAP